MNPTLIKYGFGALRRLGLNSQQRTSGNPSRSLALSGYGPDYRRNMK